MAEKIMINNKHSVALFCKFSPQKYLEVSALKGIFQKPELDNLKYRSVSVFIIQIRRRREYGPATSSMKTFCRNS
jgi:hypothetical protein